MKKALVGLVAVGALIGFLPLARRTGHKMSEHCGQMAAECKEMAAQFGARDEAVGNKEVALR
jgi:hypothetical protein